MQLLLHHRQSPIQCVEILYRISVIKKKRDRYQCHFILFVGFKRESNQTQTTLTSRVVNIIDVLNLKCLVFLMRVLIHCFLSPLEAVLQRSCCYKTVCKNPRKIVSLSSFNLYVTKKWNSAMDLYY